MQKITRAVLKFTVARRGKEISEDHHKFHFCHRITKLIKNRTLHDIMILVTTPQKHQVG